MHDRELIMSDSATRKRKISDAAVVVGSNHSNGGSVAAGSDERNFRGVTVEEDEATGAVVALSCRSRCDKDRWEAMPSLACFPSLLKIDLHQCRYITGIHESLTQLKHLRTLSLAGCSRLKSIPDTIGLLEQLEEASRVDPSVVSLVLPLARV